MTGSTDAAERRKHPRIVLLAYGFNHGCVMRVRHASYPAQLIDISPGGARIRLTGPATEAHPARGDAVLFESRIQAEALMAEIPSTIRWVEGRELGLAFDRDLPLAASDLQRRLTR